MQVLQTPSFIKQTKKLHANQKAELDAAVKKIMEDPSIGQLKKGDLSGIQVFKFKMVGQLTFWHIALNTKKYASSCWHLEYTKIFIVI